MDPTSDEIKGFATINDIFRWVGLQCDAYTEHSPYKTFLAHLGCDDGSAHWRALAFIKKDDVDALTASGRISKDSGEPQSPSALEIGQAGLVRHAACVAAGSITSTSNA